MRIRATFLDEISHDIPSNNWGEQEWAADFDAMKAVGIDTVVMIRCGYRGEMTFDSQVLKSARPMRPCYTDLVQLFLDQAERCGMRFFFGLYDSGEFWHAGQPEKELELNRLLTQEVASRYGDHPAFGGWYLSHEISDFDGGVMTLYEHMADHLKSLKDVPLLMSPFVRGRKQFEDPITPEEHEDHWDRVFKRLSNSVDIVAFQDGQVDFHELPTFMEINTRLARRHGIQPWSNVESFERGMPLKFLPIKWPNLRYKIEVAEQAGVDGLITFEFSHFMSPNSMYPSAHNLYKCYSQWLKESGVLAGR